MAGAVTTAEKRNILDTITFDQVIECNTLEDKVALVALFVIGCYIVRDFLDFNFPGALACLFVEVVVIVGKAYVREYKMSRPLSTPPLQKDDLTQTNNTLKAVQKAQSELKQTLTDVDTRINAIASALRNLNNTASIQLLQSTVGRLIVNMGQMTTTLNSIATNVGAFSFATPNANLFTTPMPPSTPFSTTQFGASELTLDEITSGALSTSAANEALPPASGANDNAEIPETERVTVPDDVTETTDEQQDISERTRTLPTYDATPTVVADENVAEAPDDLEVAIEDPSLNDEETPRSSWFSFSWNTTNKPDHQAPDDE